MIDFMRWLWNGRWTSNPRARRLIIRWLRLRDPQFTRFESRRTWLIYCDDLFFSPPWQED